jgi:hypothetical protein
MHWAPVLGILAPMIRFLPYLRFTLASPHPINVLVERLDAKTAPDRPFFYDSHGPWFIGDVTSDGFRLVANISGRNSFNPVAVGEFEPARDGARIHISMMLQPIVLAFSFVWFGLLFLIAGVTVIQVLNGNAAFHASMLMLPALLLFGWALTNGFYWLEARRTRAELMKVMDTGGPLPFERRGG